MEPGSSSVCWERRIRRRVDVSQAPRPLPTATGYHCEMCEVRCNSAEEWSYRLNGRLRRKRRKAVQMVIRALSASLTN